MILPMQTKNPAYDFEIMGWSFCQLLNLMTLLKKMRLFFCASAGTVPKATVRQCVSGRDRPPLRDLP